MTTNKSTKQSIASIITSLALNPAESLGNSLANIMDAPAPSQNFQKDQITPQIEQFENDLIESKKHEDGF